MEGKKEKQIIQAALIVLAACIICKQLTNAGWSRNVTVKETVSQDIPTELEFTPRYGEICNLQLQADTAMASTDNYLAVELYDEEDRMVFTNRILLGDMSVYQWTSIAKGLYLTPGQSYRLRLFTDEDSEILSQAYLYGISFKYHVMLTESDYIPYQMLVIFVAALFIGAVIRRSKDNEEHLVEITNEQ